MSLTAAHIAYIGSVTANAASYKESVAQLFRQFDLTEYLELQSDYLKQFKEQLIETVITPALEQSISDGATFAKKKVEMNNGKV